MLRSILPVSGLLLSTFLLLAGSGLANVLLPLRAAFEGWSPVTIGWLGAAYSAAFMAGCILIPRLVLRVGHVRVYSVVAAMLCISLLAHSLLVTVPAWIVFRAIGGFALAGAYMVVESWLNEQATNETRGTVFSVYMLINMVGLMAGQFMLVLADPAVSTLFVLAGLVYASAVIPTGISNASSPKPLAQVKLDIRKLFMNSPVAMIGALCIGANFGAWSFQGPIYGSQAGLSEAQLAFMLAIAMIGGAVLQFPIGMASDRIDRRLVLVFASTATMVVSAAMIILSPTNLTVLYIGMFLFGGFFMPLYSVAVAHGNDHADPDEFVEISSGLLIIYGIGSMVGPLMAGSIMSLIGRDGFFVNVMIVFVPFCLFTLYRMSKRKAVPDEERVGFDYTPPLNTITPESYQFDPRSEEAEYSESITPTP